MQTCNFSNLIYKKAFLYLTKKDYNIVKWNFIVLAFLTNFNLHEHKIPFRQVLVWRHFFVEKQSINNIVISLW